MYRETKTYTKGDKNIDFLEVSGDRNTQHGGRKQQLQEGKTYTWGRKHRLAYPGANSII